MKPESAKGSEKCQLEILDVKESGICQKPEFDGITK